jgi:hypothetical protein
MKVTLPHPQHESYLKHRRQVTRQIILPMALSALALIALIVLIGVATFRDNGDVGRWAAISTIWIVIPIMVASLLFLVLLGGLIYLMARLLGILPTYTGLAQDYVHLGAVYVKRFTEAAVKPVFAVDGLAAYFKAIFGSIKNANKK